MERFEKSGFFCSTGWSLEICVFYLQTWRNQTLCKFLRNFVKSVISSIIIFRFLHEISPKWPKLFNLLWEVKNFLKLPPFKDPCLWIYFTKLVLKNCKETIFNKAFPLDDKAIIDRTKKREFMKYPLIIIFTLPNWFWLKHESHVFIRCSCSLANNITNWLLSYVVWLKTNSQ